MYNNFIKLIFAISIITLLTYLLLEFNWISSYKDGLIKRYRIHYGVNKELCYQMMLQVKSILDKYNIKFWLSEGTALGIYRAGDIMDYDDDVDFAFRGDIDNQYQTFINFVIPELQAKGYSIGKIHNLYYAIKDFHFIDFDIIMEGQLCVTKGWGSSDLVIPYVNNLETIKWQGTVWNIPNQKYYEYLYGKTWKTPIRHKKP